MPEPNGKSYNRIEYKCERFAYRRAGIQVYARRELFRKCAMWKSKKMKRRKSNVDAFHRLCFWGRAFATRTLLGKEKRPICLSDGMLKKAHASPSSLVRVCFESALTLSNCSNYYICSDALHVAASTSTLHSVLCFVFSTYFRFVVAVAAWSFCAPYKSIYYYIFLMPFSHCLHRKLYHLSSNWSLRAHRRRMLVNISGTPKKKKHNVKIVI